MSDQIQEGVFFRPGETPPPHFAIAFLKSKPGATALQIDQVLSQLFLVYRELKQGRVPDLPGQSVMSGNLSVLLGFGARLFSVPGLSKRLPEPLEKRYRFQNPSSGNAILLGAGLHYSPSVSENPADADIVLQFHADTALAVHRGVVETWKVLHDLEKNNGLAPLYIVGSYAGFGRDDRRSWIDFHDGISNIKSEDRIKAIEIKDRGLDHRDAWTEKGTYMVFLRIPINLALWRSVSRAMQEVLVGRDKLTGCSITDIDPSGEAISHSGCPVTGTMTVVDKGNESFREAPRPDIGKPKLLASHIHRANQGRPNIEDPESRRIFRQGYEFFEGVNPEGQPRLGLNFVSFQDHPARVTFMLKQPGWLGGTNFGGDPSSLAPNFEKLLEVEAAGIFLVPPRDDALRFPGATVFEMSLSE
jgi:deferrochelatase/peroxidase EfeB